MTNKETIRKLREAVKIDPAANAVLHAFTIRKRARRRLTAGVLARFMAREKFHFSSDQYENVLKLLADAGVGRLETNHRGRVTALKDIQVTFKSLGDAVCGPTESELKSFKQRNRFAKMPPYMAEVAAKPKLEEYPASVLTVANHPQTGLKVRLTFMLNDNKGLDIPIPDNITPTELADLVSRLQEKRRTG